MIYTGTPAQWRSITIDDYNEPLNGAAKYALAGKDISYSLTEDGVLTISGTGRITDFTADFRPVWESEGIPVKTVLIVSGVTGIGNYAFRNCTDLTSVTIPDSVTTIAENAFSGCTGLVDPDGFQIAGTVLTDYQGNKKYVSVPDGVTRIDDEAFSGHSEIIEITLPASLKSVGSNAFSGCTGLAAVSISDLGAWCGIDFAAGSYFNELLHNAGKLYLNGKLVKELVIPEGVTRIGDGAFAGYALTDVTIPDSVTGIGKSAFSGCTGPASVTIPGSVTSIGKSAFSGCIGLTSVVISDGVAEIGDYAFSACTGLTSVTIPDSVTVLGDYAFSSCTDLTSVTIGSGVTGIGESAFVDCTHLASATVGNGVISIGNTAFSGCPLQSLTIGRGVATIGESAFTSVQSVTYPGTSRDWARIDIAAGNEALIEAYHGWLTHGTCGDLNWSLTKEHILTICGAGEMPDYSYTQRPPWNSYADSIWGVVIDPDVTSIGTYAFSSCPNLTDLWIAGDVTDVGSSALDGCARLTDVYYTGTESDWAAVTIRLGNDPLKNAQMHYSWTPQAPFDADSDTDITAADAMLWLDGERTYMAVLTLQETVGIRR